MNTIAQLEHEALHDPAQSCPPGFVVVFGKLRGADPQNSVLKIGFGHFLDHTGGCIEVFP